MLKKILLLAAAILLALPLTACSPQATSNQQSFAEGFIKTVYNVDYKTIDGDKLVEAYRKYMTRDYMDAEGTTDYIKSLAADFQDNQNVRNVETVKVAGTSTGADGTGRIGVDIVLNNTSGTDEDMYMEPGKKYVIQAIITTKTDENGNLQATDMPLPGEPTEYDGKTPLPDYVPGLDENKDKSAVYGVQEKYYRFLYDVDYKKLTPQSGEQIYDICTEAWREFNTIYTDDPMLTDPTLDTGDTAATDTAPTGSPDVTASPTPGVDAPGATDIPEGSDTSDGVKEFSQNFYESMQNSKIVDQFLQFSPISLENTGVGTYRARSYMVVKHLEGEGDYYSEMGIVMGQSYLYMVTTDISYEDGAWKIDSEDESSVIYGGKYTGTLPKDLPGTHPDTDYEACEKAATAFMTAEANIDYKVGKDKLNEHYTTLGTPNLVDTLNERGYLDARANEFIQGQLEGKYVDFQVQTFDPMPDPLGGQKYYIEGLAMVNFTSATPEYLKSSNITPGEEMTYLVDMVLAWRDGQWKVDDFEMQPYDDTQGDPGITDPALTEGTPSESPEASATPTN